jgi:hypothetical protein
MSKFHSTPSAPHGHTAGSLGLVLLALMFAGCSSGPNTTPLDPATPSPIRESTITPSPATTSTTCNPLEDGGPCLGELAAGTYRTTVFTPRITYTVTDGWANWEDLPGNFLLVPPGENLEGVNNDTSDFIGIYHGVAAAAADCQEIPEPGVGRSAKALAAWFSRHPGLVTTDPQQTTVGGLRGIVLDMTLNQDWTATCPYAHAGEPLVPLIIGAGPAALHHVINASFTTRLYLLDQGSSNIVIEVVDHPGDPLGLKDYAALINDIRFGS